MNKESENNNNNSRVYAGLFIIVIGILFLIRQAGWNIFPYWLLTWPMILIALGFYIGVKNNFRGGGWLVLLIIGGFFLFDDVLDMYAMRRYLVPAILIGVGAMLILRPRNYTKWKENGVFNKIDTPGQLPATGTLPTDFTTASTGIGEDAEKINATAIFGAVKKNIVSKHFKGGEATSIFGGSEIDLSQADFDGTVTVAVTAILGGVKLIVPSHWTVRQQVTAIFGGVEDKRDAYNSAAVQNKILVLEGTAFMGGIEITSYR